jgi:hypothetical protein
MTGVTLLAICSGREESGDRRGWRVGERPPLLSIPELARDISLF